MQKASRSVSSSDWPLVEGAIYLDRHGPYTVIAVKGTKIDIERAGGTRELGVDSIIKARIHRNMLAEKAPAQLLRKVPISFASDDSPCFSLSLVLPVIADVLRRICSKESPEYVHHPRIVDALVADSELGAFLDRLTARDPQKRTQHWWASNMMAWFSQTMTVGRSPYSSGFERDEDRSPYAYKLKNSVHTPNAAS
jgi:hypothetical protein